MKKYYTDKLEELTFNELINLCIENDGFLIDKEMIEESLICKIKEKKYSYLELRELIDALYESADFFIEDGYGYLKPLYEEEDIINYLIDNNLIDVFEKITEENVKKLRKEIGLGSIYLQDYYNSCNVDASECQNFFDWYIDYLEEKAEEDGHEGMEYDEIIKKYDNEENLLYFVNYEYMNYIDDPLEVVE